MKDYIVTYLFRCSVASAGFDDFDSALKFFYTVRSARLYRRQGREYLIIM